MKDLSLPALKILNFGGGLQTGTLMQMIVLGDLPKPDIAIFADTGDEPDYVYDQVEYSRKRLASVGVPLVTVSAGNMVDDLYNGRRFAAIPLFTVLTGGNGKATKTPDAQLQLISLDSIEIEPSHTLSGFGMEAQEITVGRLKRQCTHEYKIEPIEKEIRIALLEMRLAKETKDGRIRVKNGVWVEQWIGYSTNEADRIKPSRNPWAKFRYPLIEKRLSKVACISWLKARKLPIFKKSSCKRCPYHTDPYLLEMKQERPGEFGEVVQFDRDIRNGKLRISASAKGKLYLHASCKPLDEVDLQEGQANLFEQNLCGEVCWT